MGRSDIAVSTHPSLCRQLFRINVVKSSPFSDLTLNCRIMKSRLGGSKAALEIRLLIDI